MSLGGPVILQTNASRPKTTLPGKLVLPDFQRRLDRSTRDSTDCGENPENSELRTCSMECIAGGDCRNSTAPIRKNRCDPVCILLSDEIVEACLGLKQRGFEWQLGAVVRM